MRDVQRWRRRGLLLACVAVGLITPPVAVAAGSAASHGDSEAMARFAQARTQAEREAAADASPSRIRPAAVGMEPGDQPTGKPTDDPTDEPRDSGDDQDERDRNRDEPDDVRFAKQAVPDWPTIPDDAKTYQVKVRVTNQSDDPVQLTGWIDFDRDNKQSTSERASVGVKPAKSVREVELTWRQLGDLDPGRAKVSLRLQDKHNAYTVQIVPAPDKGCDPAKTGDDTKAAAGRAPDDYGDLSDSATHPVDGLRYAVSAFGSLVRWNPATGEHDSTYPDAVVPQGAYGRVVFDSAGDLYTTDAGTGKVYQLDLRRSTKKQAVALGSVAWGRAVGKPVLGDCMRAADFGDAPGGYSSSEADDGPAHRSSSLLTLGRTSSAEPDAVGDDLGDDALDDVPAIEPYTTQYSLTVPYRNLTNAPATLAGWLDVDLDKKFSRSERRVVVLQPGDPAPKLRWPVDEIRPSGTAYLRLRLYAGTPDNPSSNGFVDDRGEVEDYSVSVHSSPISDLGIETLPVKVDAGRSGTLPIVVRNLGPKDSDQDAMVSVTPPEHVTFGDPPSSCAASLDGSVSCRLPADRLPASGDPIALQLPFDVESSAPSDARLSGGEVTVDKPRDPSLGNNAANIRISTRPAISDLSTHIVRAPRPAVPGQAESIGLRLDNAGPSDTAAPGELVLRLPDDSLAGDSLPTDCEASDGKVTCVVPEGLAAGGHRTYDIPILPKSGLTEHLELGGGEVELKLAGDPSSANNDATFSLRTKEPISDLALTTGSDRKLRVPPGGTFPLTVRVTNRGPSDAREVTLVQSLPAVLTLDSSGPKEGDAKGCTASWNRLTCQHAVVRSGQTLTYHLTAKLASTYSGDGSDLLDAGFVNTATREAELSDNRTRNALPTAGVAHARIDLETSVSAPEETTPGTEDSLRVSVRNLGPSDTGREGREVVTLPSSVLASDLQPSGCVAGKGGTTVTCRVPAGMVPGTTHSWRIPVQVAADSPPGRAFDGGRVVAVEPTDPKLDGNRAGFRIRAGSSAADLVMTKRPMTSRPVGPGGTFSYELSVTNSGPSTAGNVVVRDRLPQPLTYLRSPDGCELRGRQLTCPSVENLPPGEFETFRVEVKLDPRYRGDGRTIAELASVSSDVRDPDTTNNQSELRTSGVPGGVVAHPPADLALVLTAEDGGEYELTAYNKGPNEAVHQTISGFLPAALTLASSPDGCRAVGQRFTCPAVESLRPGESVKRRFSVRRVPAYSGDGSDLVVWATVRSYSVDERLGNNKVIW
ncbi:GEVED domain-containing protein [Flindersiella endophytica]